MVSYCLSYLVLRYHIQYYPYNISRHRGDIAVMAAVADIDDIYTKKHWLIDTDVETEILNHA